MQVPSDSNSPSPYTALRQYGFSSGMLQHKMQSYIFLLYNNAIVIFSMS